jgi:hypothetical protein
MSERRRRNESEREVLVVWRTLAVVSLPAIKKFRIVSRSSPSVAEARLGEQLLEGENNCNILQ